MVPAGEVESLEPSISVLGAVEASVAGAQVALGSRQQQAMLAMLALRANTVVSTDALVDAIWDVKPPSTARNVI